MLREPSKRERVKVRLRIRLTMDLVLRLVHRRAQVVVGSVEELRVLG